MNEIGKGASVCSEVKQTRPMSETLTEIIMELENTMAILGKASSNIDGVILDEMVIEKPTNHYHALYIAKGLSKDVCRIAEMITLKLE